MTDSEADRFRETTLILSPHCRHEPFFSTLAGLGLKIQALSPIDVEQEPVSRCICLIHEAQLMESLLWIQKWLASVPESAPIVCLHAHLAAGYLQGLFPDRPFFSCPLPVTGDRLLEQLRSALGTGDGERPNLNLEFELRRVNKEIKDLHAIGIALSAENDPDRLLELILTKSCQISRADAGSLYLTESSGRPLSSVTGRPLSSVTGRLRFKLSRNASLDWHVKENLLIPINSESIAGHVAQSGGPVNLLDAYAISKTYPFTFNQSFDESSGYRTKSILAVPMKNLAGDVLGVIQLLNKRADFDELIPGEKLDGEKVQPFHFKDLELLASLASQAAIALENSRLVQDIRSLFEGFVKASIVAIEARDPTTCGHSERVATLNVGFAQTLNRVSTGLYRNISFSDENLTQIRYAALLHDFGKVGVREKVLVKAKKLFPHELQALKQRFRYIRKSMEADHFHRLLDFVLKYGVDQFEAMRPAMEGNYRQGLQELDEALAFLTKSNEPSVLEEGNFQRLLDLSKQQYVDFDGQTTDYLTEREGHVLAIRKGSLSEAERTEIESHVTHTFNFLSKIPWTKELARIPEIAYAHHEKLNGRGYPNHLCATEIPIESQLMTICDIYDALTAQDRPYKPALPTDKALDIMFHEMKLGLLSQELLNIFVEARVYAAIEDKPFHP